MNEIFAAKSAQWPSEGKVTVENVLFVYDIPGAPNPILDSWSLELRISPEAVKEAAVRT
jgi:hypothetical protein